MFKKLKQMWLNHKAYKEGYDAGNCGIGHDELHGDYGTNCSAGSQNLNFWIGWHAGHTNWMFNSIYDAPRY